MGAVFLYLAKAFDMINHRLLIQKLQKYRFSFCSLLWFSSYLSGRFQRVSISNTLSDVEEVKAGVPQGSVLGPILFLIFINDLPLCSQNDIDLFADDSTITAIGKNIGEISNELNLDLHNVSAWCKQNKMVINVSKTNCMCIGSKQKLLTLSDCLLKLSIDEKPLNETQCEKVLGLFIDPSLSWSKHIDFIISKVNTSLSLLRRIKKYLNHKARLLYYNAYILPQYDYCCSIWGNCNQSLLNTILKLQKRAARIILDECNL